MDSFATIISLWDSAEYLAKDIGAKGVTVRQWRNRDSIPATYWSAIVAAASRRGYPNVTFARLSAIASAAPFDPPDTISNASSDEVVA